MTLRDQISDIIETEPVTLFMKGTPSFVACGNSQRTAQMSLRWSANRIAQHGCSKICCA